MSGVKGRSGRRPKNYDQLTVQDVLKKSIHVVHCYLNDENIPLKEKAEVASRFAVKAIPERVLFDEVKKLTFEERMRLIHEFNKMMETRKERIGTKAPLERYETVGDAEAAEKPVEGFQEIVDAPSSDAM